MKDVCLAPQRNQMMIPFRITYSGGVPTLAEGGNWMTVADTGTGIATLTFGGLYGANSARTCVPVANAVGATGNNLVAIIVAPSTTGFAVECSDDAGTLADPTAITGIVCWFGSADQR